MCKPHKDDRNKNSWGSQTIQEQKQLIADSIIIDDEDPDIKVCAYCKGEVCTYENCDCGNESTTKDDLLVHVDCVDKI